MLNLHSIQRRLFAFALAAALCLPATASAMPIMDTGPVVNPAPTAPADGSTLPLVAGGVLAVVVLAGFKLRPAQVKA